MEYFKHLEKAAALLSFQWQGGRVLTFMMMELAAITYFTTKLLQMHKKEDLRPVEFTHNQGGPKNKGWFHHWQRNVNDNGDEMLIAVVEDETGQIKEAYKWSIRFLDRDS